MERWLWALFLLYTTCNNEEWFCVDDVAQTATLALLICLLPKLTVSRLFGIIVMTSPRLTQLVFYVKASNVSGSKQGRSTEVAKWEKSEVKVRTDNRRSFFGSSWTMKSPKQSTLKAPITVIKSEIVMCESFKFNDATHNALISSFSSISETMSLRRFITGGGASTFFNHQRTRQIIWPLVAMRNAC